MARAKSLGSRGESVLMGTSADGAMSVRDTPTEGIQRYEKRLFLNLDGVLTKSLFGR